MSAVTVETHAGTTSPRSAATTFPRRSTPFLTACALLVTALLLIPLVSLVVDAAHAGPAEIASVLWRPRSGQLFLNTLLLALTVTPLTIVIGTTLAWLTVRCALCGSRVWMVLLVLPATMPDFVVGYAWHTLAPTLAPLAAATLVMTLANYPFIYLPVMAALRRADPTLDEAAHSLGVGSWRTFFRVTLPPLLPALSSGALVVLMTLISEYGAFEIVRFQTFTTEIFTEFQFNPAAASALSIPLVLLAIALLTGESLIPRRVSAFRIRFHQSSVVRLGRLLQIAIQMGLGVLVCLSVAVPIGTVVGWMFSSRSSTLPAQATVAQATGTTLWYCAGGAFLALLFALPIAFLSVRGGGRLAAILERGSYLVLAVPGVVVALSLVFFTVNLAYPLYETNTLVMLAYAFVTFPLALSCLLVSIRQVPPDVALTARSLGLGPVAAFFRVTLPLIFPGVLAAFALVFLTATTELTATLVLAPLNVQTLTTQFWAFQTEGSYGAAAPYALVIMAVSVLPGALLALWFDGGGRRSSVRGVQQ